MLIEFGLSNYFSFKNGVSVSFQLDANCPITISKGLSYTPVLCVKGANASGKTHLLKGLAFLGEFCSNSFSSDPDAGIYLSSFYESEEPSNFYVKFSIDGIEYWYELSATKHEVVGETLYRKKAKRVKVVERAGNEFTYLHKDYSQLSSMKQRTNVSFISTARQYDFEGLMNIYSFFRRIITNVSYGGLQKEKDISFVSKFLLDHSEILEFVKTIISECDTGVSDIRIFDMDDSAGKIEYFPIFLHSHAGKVYPITDITESSGTKALFRNLVSYKLALDAGGVLVMDEFDIFLHPHILPKLIDLFLREETNPNGAQLIFTTHNTEILDKLGRYRTYLVNKEDNESYAYRLDEIGGDIIRNDRPISPTYDDGKIGGVPRL